MRTGQVQHAIPSGTSFDVERVTEPRDPGFKTEAGFRVYSK